MRYLVGLIADGLPAAIADGESRIGAGADADSGVPGIDTSIISVDAERADGSETWVVDSVGSAGGYFCVCRRMVKMRVFASNLKRLPAPIALESGVLVQHCSRSTLQGLTSESEWDAR